MLRPTGDNKINEEKAKILGSRMAESFRIHQDQVAAVREFVQNSPILLSWVAISILYQARMNITI